MGLFAKKPQTAADPYRAIPETDNIVPAQPTKKPPYPRLIRQESEIRMVETKDGEIIFEQLLKRRDAMGAQIETWVQLLEYNTDGKRNYSFDTAPEWAKTLLKWFMKDLIGRA